MRKSKPTDAAHGTRYRSERCSCCVGRVPLNQDFRFGRVERQRVCLVLLYFHEGVVFFVGVHVVARSGRLNLACPSQGMRHVLGSSTRYKETRVLTCCGCSRKYHALELEAICFPVDR